jgi:hypothetical protein
MARRKIATFLDIDTVRETSTGSTRCASAQHRLVLDRYPMFV